MISSDAMSTSTTMQSGEETPLEAGRAVRVAAVQMAARVGDLAHNLAKAETLASEALDNGAKIVALPEFFTTPCFVHPRVREAIVDAESPAHEMLVRLARRYGAYVGGSMLMQRGGEVYNTYCLAGPDGRVQTHDKDQPTMWENAYYIGGTDDGVVETAYGAAGLAVCWELIRWRTIRRLAGRVRFAITGNQWWSIPDDWPGASTAFGAVAQYNRYLSENAAVEFARLLGVPVLHASHCGPFEGRFLLAPGMDATVGYRSEFVGRTQIVDGAGHVVVAREAGEGPGVVIGEIEIGSVARPAPRIDRFWVPHLSLFHQLYWHHQNACGKSYYRRRQR
jgi:predicted amidohydrolase